MTERKSFLGGPFSGGFSSNLCGCGQEARRRSNRDKLAQTFRRQECVDLPLRSSAIAVRNVSTIASINVHSVVIGNVNVHVAKQMKVCRMELFNESVVWQEAMELGAEVESTTHSIDQNQRSAAGLPPSTAKVGI